MPCLNCCWSKRTEDVKPEVVERDTQTSAGNPRNKCALAPGHSLMDWIRLGSSGKDLTGVGPLAGKKRVTPEELRLHSTEKDAWISIRGQVYNITHYLNFHPGGVQQIMQGAGMDATQLFNEVHPWVNYDQILAKCHIGTLTAASDTDPTKPIKPNNIKKNQIAATELTVNKPQQPVIDANVTFDWIQKTETINFFFYTGPMSNPYIEIYPPNGKHLQIIIMHGHKTFHINFELNNYLNWPAKFKVNSETGKIDVVFDKASIEIWKTYGTMRIETESAIERREYCFKLIGKKKVTPDCFLLEFDRTDGAIHNIPIGYHVKIYHSENGVARQYTGIPACLQTSFCPEKFTTSKVVLLIKRYINGNVSKYVTSLKKDEVMKATAPYGSFNLSTVVNFKQFIMLAAGTGLNPMLGLILFLLERRGKSSEKIVLVFFNHGNEDIIFKKELSELEKNEPRLKVEFVITQEDPTWTGHKGRINPNLLMKIFNANFPNDVMLEKDIMFNVCGPSGFVDKSVNDLQSLNVERTNINVFAG